MSHGDNRGRGPARPKASKAQATQERSARARRTREPAAENGLRSASFVFRHRAGNAVVFLVLVVAAAQLFTLQVPKAAGLRAEAASQLKVTDVEKAVRGAIVDRNNDKLAFTIEARALTFQPVKIRKQLEEAKAKTPEAPDPQRRLRDIGTATPQLATMGASRSETLYPMPPVECLSALGRSNPSNRSRSPDASMASV